MHTPSKISLSKRSGWGKITLVILAEWKWHQIKLCFKHVKYFLKKFHYTRKQTVLPDFGVLVLCFQKIKLGLDHQHPDFQSYTPDEL